MAVGDWIKMRAALLNHPKVIGMVNYLETKPEFFNFICQDGITGGDLGGYDPDPKTVTDFVTRTALRYVTVSGLLALWSAARLHTQGGRIAGLSIDDLDELAGIPCFGRAMEFVGWVHVETDSQVIELVNFVEWNDPPKKTTPKSNAERQKEWRERQKEQANGTVTNVTKRNDREEKSISLSVDEELAVGRWATHYHNRVGQKFSDVLREAFLMQAQRDGMIGRLVEVIDFSISKSAKSWIDPKNDISKRQRRSTITPNGERTEGNKFR